MEPANLHHHHPQVQHQQYYNQLQFQDQFPLIGISPNSSASSSNNSCYGVSTTTNTTTHTWTPCTTTTILNSPGSGLINSYSSGAIINTTNSSSSDPLNLVSMTSTTQDLGFIHQWDNNIKQENSYPRFTQMLKSPSSLEESELSDMNAKLLLGTLSNTGLQLYPGDNNNNNNNLLYSSNSSSSSTNRGRFISQIYPTINVSNLNINQANSCSSLDMNLQPLDLINSARYGGSFSQTYGLTNHFQHSSSCESPVNSSTSTISGFSNGMPEAKRASNTLETNKGTQNAPKKSRVDSRTSCPPFKVRKEKLGDRIAALQQLVAPFGKTDTASVLMEAIGYIKFLQNQVETLSVPYMKSSRNKASRSLHGGGGEMNNEESKRDLRSRGLCLVPLSCLTYVTDGGGGVWPPPNFTGGT